MAETKSVESESAVNTATSADAGDSKHKPPGKSSKRSAKKRRQNRRARGTNGDRKRAIRPYPTSSFEEALALSEAIHAYASGERVRRLTLLGKMNKSPNSNSTKNLITNSGKYGITTGSYAAEWLDLTELGRTATAPDTAAREKLQAQFDLAISGVEPFKHLYEQYKGKKLPSHEVMKDVLREAKLPVEDEQECIDTFIVNAKFIGLLQTIAGAETLLPIEHVLDEAAKDPRSAAAPALHRPIADAVRTVSASSTAKVDWSKVCFYIAPIGDEGSEQRKHSDMFLGSLVEPALKDFGLQVLRADGIGEAGMITGQIIEHIMRARLVLVDLSYHNPNVFYEMCLRHACKLPIVQLTRKQDKLPFDISQMRTVVVDTSDIYTLVPRLETYRSEIATQVRTALAETGTALNPISAFVPGFQVSLPKEK